MSEPLPPSRGQLELRRLTTEGLLRNCKFYGRAIFYVDTTVKRKILILAKKMSGHSQSTH